MLQTYDDDVSASLCVAIFVEGEYRNDGDDDDDDAVAFSSIYLDSACVHICDSNANIISILIAPDFRRGPAARTKRILTGSRRVRDDA